MRSLGRVGARWAAAFFLGVGAGAALNVLGLASGGGRVVALAAGVTLLFAGGGFAAVTLQTLALAVRLDLD